MTLKIKLDIPLFLGLMIIYFSSLLILYSAGGGSYSLIINQSIRMVVAFVLMLIVAQIRIEDLNKLSPFLYFVGMVLLVLVLLIGYTGKGATRWLDLGVFRFQPSELMKIAVPMMLAWLLSKKAIPSSNGTILQAALVLALPAGLILKQPDLGTTLMITMSGLVIIFVTGFSWKKIIGLFLFVCACMPFLWNFLHDYQQRRILTLFNPKSDPLGDGYHIIQSMIAIGSGGVQGKGWLQGSQSQLEFIPERHTDFIFSVFAEEFGFVGVILLLGLYLFVVCRGLYIGFQTKDIFASMVAVSISMTFFFYVFVNIGMVSGLLPVVGVPLPLISYGGTSMVTLMIGFGILMSVQQRKTFRPSS